MKRSLPYLLPLSLMLLLVSPALLSKGMFVDGVVYSCVANNMAQGIGSFWNPSYTPAMYAQFYEQPPLAMGMLALLYKLLGDGMWVEKAYAVLMVALCALLTVRLWKMVSGESRYGWIPLLLLALVPDVSHFATSNMLEHTMSVFVLLAVMGIVLSVKGRRPLPLLAAGVALAGALLVKGPVGLYPLALPLMLWLAGCMFPDDGRQAYPFGRMVRDTLFVLGGAVAALLLVLLAFPASRDFLMHYYERQIVEGMATATVKSRFFIVAHLFLQLLIPILAAVAAGCVARYGKRQPGVGLAFGRQAAAMLLLTLCGVLPMMLSLKQRGYYILTVYPFACIGIGLLLQPVLSAWTARLGDKARCWHRVAGWALLAAAVTANVVQVGKYGRDKELQADLSVICSHIEPDAAVQVPTHLYYNYPLHAYAYRMHRLSLHDNEACGYLLLDDEAEFAAQGYDSLFVAVGLPTQRYHLYSLKMNVNNNF